MSPIVLAYPYAESVTVLGVRLGPEALREIVRVRTQEDIPTGMKVGRMSYDSVDEAIANHPRHLPVTDLVLMGGARTYSTVTVDSRLGVTRANIEVLGSSEADVVGMSEVLRRACARTAVPGAFAWLAARAVWALLTLAVAVAWVASVSTTGWGSLRTEWLSIGFIACTAISWSAQRLWLPHLSGYVRLTEPSRDHARRWFSWREDWLGVLALTFAVLTWAGDHL